MKRGWTRFWGSVSLAAVTALQAGGAGRPQQPAKRVNELTLAGMRPGRDTVARAAVRRSEFVGGGENESEYRWKNGCRPESLTVLTQEGGIVSEVRVSGLASSGTRNCAEQNPPSRWRTGRTLGVNDPAIRVVQLYGQPDSRSPSTKSGQRLELLYYAFDWAGPDVPQVMEVVCTVGKDGEPGRVVEITLAASSL